ncbi:hypothetical protein Acor_81770 [Acrocarpospora corrugata]|uniref:Uncharacterized protein n=1 Tax=Acrocarpospora corrugata TaxID=35763 RepID=A0A5M3WIC3_9ACTN|nr:MFS transporter [Acrocarpospora corrugata]GES06108.1 hypothetical protein Acor_81770 [Acrocarpospora corrugata]
MPAALPFRVIRATAFAVVCAGLAAVAHALGGAGLSAGDFPAGLVISFAAAMPLTSRERSLKLIMLFLAGVQLVLHLLFTVLEAPASGMVVGHVHAELTSGIGMLLVHTWSIVLTAMWLAKGEALLWTLLRTAGARLPHVLALLVALPSLPPVLFVGTDARSVPSRHRTDAISRRGPP